jgi:hypothetical protein
MGRSHLGWAASVVAPWCLAAGVLLSITAEAGQEPFQLSGYYDRARLLEESDPVRKAMAVAAPLRAVDADGIPLPLAAPLSLGGGRGGEAGLDEIEPRATLKASAEPFPDVDGSARGDLLRSLPGGRKTEFDPDHTMSPARPGEAARMPASPPAAFSDGATPAAPLDFALNSSSPTSSDGVVVVVEIDPNAQPAALPSPLGGGKPDYAALVDPKDRARQMRCLAEAIYFESRSEPEAGQAAVAQVVLNRVRSGIYPATVCAVVYQDRNRPFACQFSFACEGKSLRIEEPGPWAVATRIADDVVSGKAYDPAVAEAVNYHANYVAPFWVGYLRRVDRIGAHIFYAMRDGTNWAPGALNGHGDHP